MITTVNEVNSDKTKVSDEFIFHCSVLLVCFTAEPSISFDYVKVKLVIKTRSLPLKL